MKQEREKSKIFKLTYLDHKSPQQKNVVLHPEDHERQAGCVF